MKKPLVLLLSLVVGATAATAQNPAAFALFDGQGRAADFEQLVAKAAQSDMVFFGELHDNPLAHWMQLLLAQRLEALDGKGLLMGAEMLEADNQLLLDEMLAGLIEEGKFEEEARLWPNYATDYRPLVQFAAEKGLRFVATNVPRRYASVMFKKGEQALEAFPETSKAYMAPLPLRFDPGLGCYAEMIQMGAMMPGHDSENFAKSQALKDATMAHFILKAWSPGQVFLHFNGSFHSDRHQGIVWHIEQQRPGLRHLVVTTVLQSQLQSLDPENKGLADFILVVDERMTSTH